MIVTLILPFSLWIAAGTGAWDRAKPTAMATATVMATIMAEAAAGARARAIEVRLEL